MEQLTEVFYCYASIFFQNEITDLKKKNEVLEEQGTQLYIVCTCTVHDSYMYMLYIHVDNQAHTNTLAKLVWSFVSSYVYVYIHMYVY